MSGQMSDKKVRKRAFRAKLEELLDKYKNIFVLTIDNVGSNQMQQVRLALRGRAELLMGKNTIIRLVVAEAAKKNPKLEALLPHLKGNMGFCFTNETDLAQLRQDIISNKVPAAAKSGAFAPISVTIPAGPTGLDPGQTAFFQAMNIATKIVKGTIEIVTEVKLITANERVTASAVALLSKLNIKPFFFGIVVATVYEDGEAYDAAVMDLTEADLLNKFFGGVRHVAALSMALNYPTLASLPHIIMNGFNHIAALGLATGCEFPLLEEIKKNVGTGGGGGGGGGGAAPAAAAPAPAPEPEEEEEMDFDLFG